MRLPRLMAGIVAGALGYFWLPCPICGEMMAGFEDDGGAWMYGPVEWMANGIGTQDGTGVCRRCGPEARRRNERGEWAPRRAGSGG